MYRATQWDLPRTTDLRWLNPQFLAAQIQIPIPNKYLGFGYSPNVSTTPVTAMGCRQCLPLSVVQLKGLTVPKWVLINWPKISKMHQNLSAQAQKFRIWWKKVSLGFRSPWNLQWRSWIPSTYKHLLLHLPKKHFNIK
jgi:hypothetical protein